MLRNHIRVALRHLARQKGYTALNVVGLAVGLVCCGFIALYVQDERSYDRHHEHADRVYRLVREIGLDTGTSLEATTSGPMAPSVAAEVPGVEEAVRVVQTSALLEHGEGAERVRTEEDEVAFADAGLFDVFTLPLVAGDARTALAAPGRIVLTETLARTHFGTADPMGQTLLLDGETPVTVSGVMRDLPSTTHLPFTAAVSWGTWDAVQRAGDNAWLLEEWNANYLYTYVLLAPGVTAAQVERALPAFAERHLGEAMRELFVSLALELQPVTDIHLGEPLVGEPSPTTDPARLTLFALIGAFILLIAAVNFVNLATARAAGRAREVGVRKAVGAQQGQLVRQFLAESVLVSTLAFVLALGASQLLLPGFDALAGKEVDSLWAHGGVNVLALGVLALVVGLGAGLYPAFVLSGFRPAAVLRGPFRGSRRGVVLRQGLVVLQFAVSIALIAGTAVVYAQLHYMRSQPLGFAGDQLVSLDVDGDSEALEARGRIREELMRLSGVRDVAVTSSVPGEGYNVLSIQYEGPDGTIERAEMNEYSTDEHFVATYGLELVAGRAIQPSDSSRGYLLNETAVARLGWASPEEAIGKRFGMNDPDGEIVGVVRDFHYTSLEAPIEPLFMHNFPVFYSGFTLRLAPGDVRETLAGVERAWATLAPQRPFSYTFLDDSFDQQYRADAHFGRLVGVFAGLAILVACLGLFGLAAFSAEQRRKEIGVRKVLGASVPSIVALLSRDTVRLLGIAFVLAAPVAYLGMSRWLEGFAYRVPLGPTVFLLAGAVVLAIALVTVSTQTFRAATADPVRSLRSE
ncbi:MAG TPA: ABC transporter permease [Rhodothermales bacterium]|nr:ABC transporter permease [Rhodothermales bacterium]